MEIAFAFCDLHVNESLLFLAKSNLLFHGISTFIEL